MKVYVAGSTLELDRAARAMEFLALGGIAVTSTWVTNIERSGGVANPRDVPDERRSEWADGCLAEIAASDLIWFLVPTIHRPTRGAWLEIGYAHAIGKPIVCSGDTRQSIFCSLGSEFHDDEGAAAHIARMARR